MAVQLSPKILGLNIGIFGTVIGLCVLFLCVITGKINNMLVV